MASAKPIQAIINEGIREYRILGRTGFKVSDIGFGRPANAGLIKASIDQGVNYLDTAPNYGTSEKDIGEAIEGIDRESLFITTKFKSSELVDEAGVLKSAYKSLEDMKTDYIDCLMLQAAENRDITRHKGFHSAIRKLKKEGKVRFAGLSCHGKYFMGNPVDTMENILLAGVEDGRFDIILVVYNFVNRDQGQKVLEACKKKNIGTTVMKTNPVRIFNMINDYRIQLAKDNNELPENLRREWGKYETFTREAESYLIKNGITDYDSEFRDVAMRYVLNNRDVDCALIDFQNFEGLKAHIQYSGTYPDPIDEQKARDLREAISFMYCRHGCGKCEPECPHNVPVNTIMRYNYYFTLKGREKQAMKEYLRLPGGKPDACISCPGYCGNACPYGVLVRPLLAMAHHNLSAGELSQA